MTIAETAFNRLTAIAGRLQPDFVHINSAAAALQTHFYAREAAPAIVATGATMAPDLWRMRGGAPRQVDGDARAASASLISFSYQTVRPADQSNG